MASNRKVIISILVMTAVALIWGCSATRYVPQGKYLLRNNVVNVKNPKDAYKSEIVTADDVSTYIKQRPNTRFLGMGLSLGIYNMTDSSKHNWWHKLWNEKIGSAPVIFDSAKMEASNKAIHIYLQSRGFLSAYVSDSVTFKNRKATVEYIINHGAPYSIAFFERNIEDPFLRELLKEDSVSCLVKVGDQYSRELFQKESDRITKYLNNNGFYTFGSSYIDYDIDSSWNDNTVSVTMNIKRRIEDYTTAGEPIYENHPIYRISRIVVNSDFNPTASIENKHEVYDSVEYNGIVILYKDKLQIKPEFLVSAIRLSPNSLYDYASAVRTNDNLRAIGYSPTILFSIIEQDTSQMPMVTLATSDDSQVSTTEQQLVCLIQCTPSKKQNYTAEFEVGTTASYTSMALKLSYQNRNLFRGAENFSVNIRGAYEFVKTQGRNNSYEIGVTTALSIPRFWLPLNKDKLANVRQKSTKLQLNYSIQERPDYHRTVIGGSYGYGWSTKIGGRFLINPVDVSIVSVPWINQSFIDSIDNPYLRNSYNSQMIIGMSALYSYNTNSYYKQPGYNLRVAFDANGNLLSLFNSALGHQTDPEGEQCHTIFGMRYAQYIRASIDYSARHNFNDYTQIAWRIFLGAGLPYSNSYTLPFERLFFAGGSNSMRGWQVRTLGPGGTPDNKKFSYPNQLGDMRLEANLEFRFNVWGGLNLAIFFDAGNIWMNSKARESDVQNFRFDTFYKQIALNTGAGIRWDFDFVIFRLDWGLKLHSPGMPHGQKWFKQMGLSDSALHFAIGLPF